MQSDAPISAVSKGSLWTARAPSGWASAFLLLDALAKFFKPQPVIDAFVRLSFPLSLVVPIGVLLLACVVLYVVPQTSIMGRFC